MSKFIRLHLRRPRVFFNVDKIETFSDHKVNDIDVCETADEILQQKNNTKEKELLKSVLSWLPDGSKFRGGRYAQLQNLKRKIMEVLNECKRY